MELADYKVKCFVYVIGVPGQPQKVGFASNVERRRAALQTSNPHRLEIAFTLETTRGNAVLIENYTHWMLQRFRLMGEWFDVTPEFAAKAVRAARYAVDIGSSPMAIADSAKTLAGNGLRLAGSGVSARGA